MQLSNTRDLATALRAAGADVRKIAYAGLGHMGLVLAILRPFRWRAPVLREVVELIESNKILASASCTRSQRQPRR